MSQELPKVISKKQDLRPDLFNGTLVERIDVTPDLALFRVLPDRGVDAFEPGQYTTLGLPETDAEVRERLETTGRGGDKPKLVLRAYSIASSPKVRDYIEFFLIRVDDGKLTPKLWHLHEGDRLFIGPKITGKFTLEHVPPGKDLVMIATGTGLAPFISMLHTYRGGTDRWRRIVIIHGTRLSADLAYRAELQAVSRDDPSVIYIPTVTREPDESDWDGMRGRVHVALEPEVYQRLVGEPMTPEFCHVFLCGNPTMIDQVSDDLTGRGFLVCDREHPQGNIHFERYW